MDKQMSGSVSRYGKDRWQYRGRYGDGKAFRVLRGTDGKPFTTRRDAATDLKRFMDEGATLGPVAPEKITVGEWLDEWLTALRSTHRDTTISGYKETIESRISPYIGDKRLRSLTEADVRSYYQELVAAGYSTNTIMGAHRRLRAALRTAVRERKAIRCVADNVIPPHGVPQKKMRTWSFEEIQAFTAHISAKRDAAMWAFWVTTGVRRGELCGLKWSKVDLDNAIVRIDWQRTITSDGKITEGEPKTEKGKRWVPLSPEVVAGLREWKASQSAVRLATAEWQGEDYVFTSMRRGPYSPHSFNGRLAKLATSAELPVITPHELRHTFATRARKLGISIEDLAEMLGHSKVEIAMNLYVHPEIEEMRAQTDALSKRMLG